MCLAVPGQVLEIRAATAVVDLNGNRAEVCTVLTPDVRVRDWVLVHAGFAITRMEEEDARDTWDFLAQSPMADEVSLEEDA